MWQLEYNAEVAQYFFDNDPYTFPLLIRIEELKFEPDAIPPEVAHRWTANQVFSCGSYWIIS
ncbi:MAG: hypothetical protein HC802_12925 [Caldilineaceae bacterium]|nr:hypothetical protein [Caldilineaceae bacterium]